MKGNKVPSEHWRNVRVFYFNFFKGVQKPIVELPIELACAGYWLSAIDFVCA
jgi:hypothetical protein